MGKQDKLRRKLLGRPIEMLLADVQQVLEGAGWEMRQGKGSHVTFHKDGQPMMTMRVTGGRTIGPAAIRDAARAIAEDGE